MKLDDLCETLWDRHKPREPWSALNEFDRNMVREDLRAVLRKHIEPMIAEAYAAGSRDGYAFLRGTHETDYARRAITAIVEK